MLRRRLLGGVWEPHLRGQGRKYLGLDSIGTQRHISYLCERYELNRPYQEKWRTSKYAGSDHLELQFRQVRSLTRRFPGSSGTNEERDTLGGPSGVNPGSAVSAEESTRDLIPINFDAAASIEGAESQILKIRLSPGQQIRAETGAFLYMTPGIEMETSTAGGFKSGMKRWLTGENFFMSDFENKGTEDAEVVFGTDFPSKILRLPLKNFDGEIICQRGAFLCGSPTINIEMEFAKKFGVGFFGGEGFVLQKLSGEGDAFVKAGGALIERDLAAGEILRISSGCLVAFSSSVQYDIQMLSGFKNIAFGGEGLFLTTLTGPGRVYLQGLPFDRMVQQIAGRIGGSGGHGLHVPLPMGGGAAGEAAGGGAAGAAGAAGAGAMGGAIGEAVGGSSSSAGEGTSAAAATAAGAASSADTGPSSGSIWGAAGDSASSPSTSPPSAAGSSREEVWTEDEFGKEDTEAASADGGEGEEGGGGRSIVRSLWGTFFGDDDDEEY